MRSGNTPIIQSSKEQKNNNYANDYQQTESFKKDIKMGVLGHKAVVTNVYQYSTTMQEGN